MEFITDSDMKSMLTMITITIVITIICFIGLVIFALRRNLIALTKSFLFSLLFNEEEDLINYQIMTKTERSYPVKHTCITTCGELYQKWKLEKPLYEKAPKNGISVDIEYADTLSLISNGNNYDSHPVVLALHGAPGSHADFEPIIQHLAETGVRVIAPNFPNYSVTVITEVFRHSAEEKAEFIKDFLKIIGVNKIDMLISHSSAIYPSLILWSDPNGPQINSFAFLNPGGHRRIQAMRPVWFTEGSVKVYQNKLGRIIFKTFGTTFLNITKTVTVKADNMNNVILSATTMRYSGFKQLTERLIKLRQSKTPVLLVFSENDRLIEKEIFYEMADILGAKDANIAIYSEDESIEKHCSSVDNIKVLSFRSGGHYAFLKYPNSVNKACDELLHKAINRQINDGVINETFDKTD